MPPVNRIPAPHPAIAGRHILIVEGETLIALDLQDLLLRSGAATATIARHTVEATRRISDGAAFDAAIVTVNPLDLEAMSAARAIAAQGIPFMFATGASDEKVTRAFPGAQIV